LTVDANSNPIDRRTRVKKVVASSTLSRNKKLFTGIEKKYRKEGPLIEKKGPSSIASKRSALDWYKIRSKCAALLVATTATTTTTITDYYP